MRLTAYFFIILLLCLSAGEQETDTSLIKFRNKSPRRIRARAVKGTEDTGKVLKIIGLKIQANGSRIGSKNSAGKLSQVRVNIRCV